MENLPRDEYYTQLPLPVEPPLPPAVPTPDDPPWGPWSAFGIWILSVVFILFVPAFFLLPYLAMQPELLHDAAAAGEFAKTDPKAIFLQIVAILPAHLLTIAAAWLVVTQGRRFSFKKMLGWSRGRFAWWHFFAILAGFIAFANVVDHFWPEKENDLTRILQSSRSAVYIIALVATFTAPLVEEVVYRGVVYSAFRKHFGVAAGFVVATLLFALVHVPQYYPSYSTIFLLTMLSVTLTSIRVISGNLLPCIILHTIFNGLQSVLLILQPLTDQTAPPPDPTGIILHIFR